VQINQSLAPPRGERKKGWGAEEQRCGGAEVRRCIGRREERTDHFWIQSSRNPSQNFVHPLPRMGTGVSQALKLNPDKIKG